MMLQELAKKRIHWIAGAGPLMSSRIRLARNIKGYSFPGKCGKEHQSEIFEKTLGALKSSRLFENPVALRLNSHDRIDRFALLERHLISQELVSRERGEPGVIFTRDEAVSVMVNEEDHLRIQILFPGVSFHEAWKIISCLDDHLAGALDFSFSGRYGYLTSCPTNAGTGMRVSCLLYLGTVAIKNEIARLVKWLEKMSLNVRGFYGEGTKPAGSIFQISSTITMGSSEEEIIDTFRQAVEAAADYERKTLENLTRDERAKLEDSVWRSYGALKYCRIMDSEEAIVHLTKLRTGISMGIGIGVDVDEINQLIFKVQPGHVQEIYGKELNAFKRDAARAALIRSALFKEK
jgi:protein arginine kinase